MEYPEDKLREAFNRERHQKAFHDVRNSEPNTVYVDWLEDKLIELSNNQAKSDLDIVKKRFLIDGTTINGFYAIYDTGNEYNTIWIDCPKDYLQIIINALNDNFPIEQIK